jgi:hypothetical protein
MFNCVKCHKPVGPGIKPIVQVIERPATYVNYDEDGKEIITHGSEIEKEFKLCKECAA